MKGLALGIRGGLALPFGARHDYASLEILRVPEAVRAGPLPRGEEFMVVLAETDIRHHSTFMWWSNS